MPELMDIVRGQGRRIDRVELELAAMRDRMARLEGQRSAAPAAPAAPMPAPPAPPPPPAAVPAAPPPPPAAAPAGWLPPVTAPPWAASRPPRQRVDVEEVLGGRVLGLAGGLAVLLGVAFLVAMAVDRGWIDEPTRIAIGFAGCTVLLAAAVWLYERRGHTQAALAAAGSAVAGLFATLTAGAQLYDLFPVPVSLAIAGAVGAAATALGLRWGARTFAALGLVGAVAAPLLVGAEQSGLTMSFVLLVLASAVTVGGVRRWEWLAPAASLTAAPQIVDWLSPTPETAGLLVVLALFWVVNVVAAGAIEWVGHEPKPRVASLVLIGGAGALAVIGGYFGLEELGHGDAANAWVGIMAAAHLALGLAATREAAISRDLSHAVLAGGLVLADVTVALTLDGIAVGIAWAASAVALAALARVVPAESVRLQLAAGAQLGLALLHVVAIDATPDELWGAHADLTASVTALGVLGLAALAAAQLLPRGAAGRGAGHAVALGVLAYLTAFVIDGPGLAVAWAVEAVAVMALARLGGDERPDRVATVAALGLLGLAVAHALAFEAVPRALVYGVDDLLDASIALAAFAAAALAMPRLLPRAEADARLALDSLAAAALVYLGSVAIVTAFQPGADTFESSVGLLDVRQQGQLLLSAFWAVTGVGALLVGLGRDRRAVRLGGFALLGIATAKVFLFDLSELESLYRVGSFVALGLLLLGAAFAWQRTRRNGDGDGAGLASS